MSIPSIYINLEDDVAKIVTRLKHQSAKQVVLVCPKRSFLFSDSVNLKLLKKQTDLLGKEVFILTMDEKGQTYAKQAGFQLKFLPKVGGNRALSDIKFSQKAVVAAAAEPEAAGVLESTVNEIKHIAQKFVPQHKPHEEQPQNKPVAKISSSVKHHAPKFVATETVFANEEEAPTSPVPKKSHMNKAIAGLVVISLIIIVLLIFVVLPKATVMVYPKTEPVTRDMEISMSSNLQAVDVDKLI
ncbi:MAG TPA: hypothetical protein VE973_00055, partial [Candidatus Limnocylindria bacterium]|nr:hypothetical protein [Candidatus Limnocylindria bacterium]